MCRAPDYYRKMTDFVVICPINQYIGKGEYMMIDLEKINTIKLDKKLEHHFEQSTPEKQQEVLEWLCGGPTSRDQW